MSARCLHRSLTVRTEADGCSWVLCRCGFSGPRKHSYALALMAWVDEALERSPTAAATAGGASVSLKIMSRVWEVSLPHADKLLLLALADNANDEGHCWPSVAALGRKCGMEDRSIRRVIKRLIGAGHVTVRQQSHTSNDYIVHPQAGPNPPRSTA
jgi:hypothetical protein